ncbi:hypothetical protein [Methylocapsa aurea]|uniref:hypothetical protein n=1 Tax=Methylocapsa aurea TaxID=663610 RepID=UPI00055D02DE|nr:hypothetical protein [Methylocapsa aurea]
MGLIELILTVCSLAQPSACEERQLSLIDQGSLMQCMLQAPPKIAQWADGHPNSQVVKWRCSYPGSEGKTL